MKLGLFMMPLHPASRPLHETLDENIEKGILADHLGFDEVWMGEHFSATTEPVVAPLMYLATILHRTKRVKLATGVIALPNHHPVIVAGEVAMFDHLSKGRFILGIGPGGLASDMELFKQTDATARAERMQESIDTILEIWKQNPPYRIAGKYWDIDCKDVINADMGIGYQRKPYQLPHPEIASSAMSPFSSSMKTAGMMGWSPVSANFTPTYSVKSHWQKYLEGCAASGREPDGDLWRVARNICVAPTDAEAKARVWDPAGSNYYYFWYIWKALQAGNFTICMKSDPKIADDTVTAEMLVDDLVIYGSPKTVVEKIIAFREEVGPFGGVLMSGMDWSGVNRQRETESMKLLAENVMPTLRKAIRTVSSTAFA